MKSLRVTATALVVLLLSSLFIIITPSGPAMALGTCPPGAPPMSSLCSPTGFVVMQGAYDTAKGAAIIRAGTATAATAAGAFAVKSATDSNAAVFNDVFGIGQDTIDPTEITYNPDAGAGYLEVIDTGFGVPGYDGGGSGPLGVQWEWQYVYYPTVIDYVVDMGVEVTPTYGADGVVTIRTRCDKQHTRTSYGNDTVGEVFALDGSSAYIGYAPCRSPEYADRTYSTDVPGESGLSHVEFIDGTIYRPPMAPGRFEGGDDAGGLAGEIVANTYCVGAGGLQWVVSNAVEVFGFRWAMDGSSCKGTGPDGANGVIDAFSVNQMDTGGGTRSVFEYDAPAEVTRIPTEFPNCLDGGAECTLQLWKVTQGQPEQWCGNAAVGCPDWWASSSKADHYQCRYGNYTVDLGVCSLYRKPGQVSPNTGVTFLEDGTMVSGGTVTSLNPDDYEELDRAPDTGLGTVPGWQPAPNTGTGTVPWPGPGPAPAPVPGTGTGTGSITNNANCIGSWGALNPLEWVYIPVKCALEWAFVPRPEVVNGLVLNLREDVFTKPPFVIVDAGVSLVSGLLGGYTEGVCAFPDFWPTLDDVELKIDCSPPEGWDTVYNIQVVMVWAGALWGAVRLVAKGVGNQEVEA